MGKKQGELAPAAEAPPADLSHLKHNIRPELWHLAWPIHQLRPYGENAKLHDEEKAVESLRTNGQYRPIVVWRQTMEVLAGNGIYAAAMAEKWEVLAVTFVDCDEAQARIINLVDNELQDRAGYDTGLLLAQIDKLSGQLTGTGFDENSVNKLREKVAKSLAEPIGLGNPVVQYNIVFDDEQQQESWYAFVRYLKKTYPDAGSLGERLKAFIGAYFEKLEEMSRGEN